MFVIYDFVQKLKGHVSLSRKLTTDEHADFYSLWLLVGWFWYSLHSPCWMSDIKSALSLAQSNAGYWGDADLWREPWRMMRLFQPKRIRYDVNVGWMRQTGDSNRGEFPTFLNPWSVDFCQRSTGFNMSCHTESLLELVYNYPNSVWPCPKRL